ncbi:hypothetical protein LTR37_013419 [Vermiconidia calcicola]|uniref:Uncharacterized protein n=1 Tax=Vermiconidia calcicola TaxID=1690605 RepID=A0ACC3MX56_9PEZI|nr:hypothetical protein LTR37_013419 [Vermiconidia calcicola]
MADPPTARSQSTRSRGMEDFRGRCALPKLPFRDYFLVEITRGVSCQPFVVIVQWVEELVEGLKRFKTDLIDDQGRYQDLCDLLGHRWEDWLGGVDGQVEICMRVAVGPLYTAVTAKDATRECLANIANSLVGTSFPPGTQSTGSMSKLTPESLAWKFRLVHSLMLSVLMDLQQEPTGYFQTLLGGAVVGKWTGTTQDGSDADFDGDSAQVSDAHGKSVSKFVDHRRKKKSLRSRAGSSIKSQVRKRTSQADRRKVKKVRFNTSTPAHQSSSGPVGPAANVLDDDSISVSSDDSAESNVNVAQPGCRFWGGRIVITSPTQQAGNTSFIDDEATATTPTVLDEEPSEGTASQGEEPNQAQDMASGVEERSTGTAMQELEGREDDAAVMLRRIDELEAEMAEVRSELAESQKKLETLRNSSRT